MAYDIATKFAQYYCGTASLQRLKKRFLTVAIFHIMTLKFKLAAEATIVGGVHRASSSDARVSGFKSRSV